MISNEYITIYIGRRLQKGRTPLSKCDRYEKENVSYWNSSRPSMSNSWLKAKQASGKWGRFDAPRRRVTSHTHTPPPSPFIRTRGCFRRTRWLLRLRHAAETCLMRAEVAYAKEDQGFHPLAAKRNYPTHWLATGNVCDVAAYSKLNALTSRREIIN